LGARQNGLRWLRSGLAQLESVTFDQAQCIATRVHHASMIDEHAIGRTAVIQRFVRLRERYPRGEGSSGRCHRLDKQVLGWNQPAEPFVKLPVFLRRRIAVRQANLDDPASRARCAPRVLDRRGWYELRVEGAGADEIVIEGDLAHQLAAVGVVARPVPVCLDAGPKSVAVSGLDDGQQSATLEIRLSSRHEHTAGSANLRECLDEFQSRREHAIVHAAAIGWG